MKKTLVWAHRGASAYAPENTLPAFEKAVEMKADGIELDVQMTKDGELVVIHDERLERVSDGKGYVKDYTYAELLKLNFNQKFPQYGNVRIPTLEQVYLLIKPTDLTINVEIKTGEIFYPEIEERVIDLTERYGLSDRVIYSSFNHYTVRKVKELCPKAEVGMLYCDGMIDPVAYARETVKADAIHPAFYNIKYPGVVKACKEDGIKIHVWTVNEETEMRELCEWQIDAMITNDPVLGRKIADEYRDGKILPELVRKLERNEEGDISDFKSGNVKEK